MSFLAAPLLFGLALAATPIIIHLLNRRRFIVLDWAPMKYLKLTIRTNKRRVQIEQLLLLLLRTLLVMLLVFTVARPALTKAGLGRWLTKRSRVSRVIVIDTSLPMGYRTEGTTALDRAKSAVAEIVRSTGPQDSVTILVTTPGAVPIVKEAAADDPNKLIADVNAVQTTDLAAEWATLFQTIDDSVSTATFPQKQLVLITDLRRSGWSNKVTPLAEKWAKAGVEARVVDVGNRSVADVALLKFAQDDPVAVPGVPLHLTAVVRNRTGLAMDHANAQLTLDGQSRPVELPPIAAGATQDVSLSVTPDKPGQHVIRLKLPDDALEADNVRTMTVDARDHIDLTLLDGRTAADPSDSSSHYVSSALLSLTAIPWHITTVSDSDPIASKPAAADVTVMTDVASLSSGAVDDYEKFVRDGMGLIIFLGDQTRPDDYNRLLYKDGKGLLPGQLTQVVDNAVKGIAVDGFSDSPLLLLTHVTPTALAQVPVKKLMGIDVKAENRNDVRVLARWNDPENHPAVIEKKFGKGRVILFTTSADTEWGDWPKEITFPFTVIEAAKAVVRPSATDDNLSAGHPIAFVPPDTDRFTRSRVTSPDSSTPHAVPSGGPAIIEKQTPFAGVYTLGWFDAAGVEKSHQVAVSYDTAAAELEPMPTDQLKNLLGSLKAEVVPYVPQQLAAAGGGREIWRNLAVTLGILLLVETAFAFYVGRER